jgi:hypothetical protein
MEMTATMKEGTEPVQISTLKQYLDWMVTCRKTLGPQNKFKFSCMEDFILSYGRLFPNYMPKPKWVRKGIIKQCFSNCAKAVMKNPERLIYCEGFASGIIPVNHAWCLTLDGQVIDPTWDGRKDIKREGTEYFGIPFKFDYVLRIQRESGHYGVLDNWHCGFPLFTGDHKPEEFLHAF